MKNKHRTQFTFYRWFAERICALELSQQGCIFEAMGNYALYGKLPDLTAFTGRTRRLWYRIFFVLWWGRMWDLLLGRNLSEEEQ